MRRFAISFALLAACGSDDGARATTPYVPDTSGGETGQSSSPDPDSASSSGAADSGTPQGEDSGSDDTTAGEPAAPIACTYPSTTFGQPMQHLDVMDPDSSIRLSFTVEGLPDPSLVESATLHFSSYDADHPGEEGYIYVNDGPGLDIPAQGDWDEADGSGSVDITDYVQAGTNRIDFGPGPLEWSYFFIGDVEIDAIVHQPECAPEDPPDDGPPGVMMEIAYADAEYTERHNWVFRCNGHDYAFTAVNTKHADDDCGGLYAPDGSAHGTATFHFEGVIDDDYLVEVHAYHTYNRNPNGALLIVDGIEGRVNQRTDMEGEAEYATAEWGVARLSGDVDIVLDSSEGGYASDAVTWVRITPM